MFTPFCSEAELVQSTVFSFFTKHVFNVAEKEKLLKHLRVCVCAILKRSVRYESMDDSRRNLVMCSR